LNPCQIVATWSALYRESPAAAHEAKRGGAVAKRSWTATEVRKLGIATNIETAASVLGIGRTTAYALARKGAFPAPVLRVGKQYVVSVEGLLVALGAEAPAEDLREDRY
jgi:hypothetical protein